MANIVESWLEQKEEKILLEFLFTEKHELIKYHSTTNRDIRNHFSLWSYEWEPDIRGGVEYSLEHPHQVSMQVLEEVWRRKRKEYNI